MSSSSSSSSSTASAGQACWLCATRRDAGVLPAAERWLGERERAALAALANPRRRDDWLRGRWVAKHALAAAEADPEAADRTEVALAGLAGLEVLSDEDGAPEPWRGDRRLAYGLSLSHRGGRAVALATAEDIEIGCDLELLEPRSEALVLDFFTEAERALVAASADAVLVANVIWSAKESALKALRVGLSRDTRSVEVAFVGDEGPTERPWRALVVDDRTEGRRFVGGYRVDGGAVVTICASESLRPPEILRV